MNAPLSDDERVYTGQQLAPQYVDELLDDLAGVSAHWARNRESGRPANAIRAALLMLCKEIAEKTP